MSYTLSLSGVEELSYVNTVKELKIDNLKIIESSYLKEDGLWPQGYTHIYMDNVSTRPLELEYDGNNLNIRILSSSSPEDYHLAVQLIGTITKEYNSEICPEDSERLKPKNFIQKYNKEWCEKHSYQMIDFLFSMIKSEQSTFKISTINREYEAGPRVLAQIETFDNRHEEFLRRIKFFNYTENNDVFVPSLLVLHNDEKSKKVKLATLTEGVDSLISADANAIGLISLNALSSDSHEKVIISTDVLLNLIKNDIVWVSENNFYIDGFSDADWKNFYTQAEKYHLADLFEVGTELTEKEKMAPDGDGLISSFKERFSNEEWKKLSYSPFLSFLLVSLADGSVDKKELKAFVSSLSKQVNPLMTEILESLNQAPNEIITELMTLGEDAPYMLQEVAKILDSNLPQNYALAFKFELMQIGKKVAEASGGFFGFGKKISKEEEMALVVIAKMLEIA